MMTIDIIKNEREPGLEGLEGIHTTFIYKNNYYYLASDKIPGVENKPYEVMLFNISKDKNLTDCVNYWRFDDTFSMEEMHKYILENPEKYII